jgi:hypothetical protein
MAYSTYSTASAFHWRSALSQDRQEEIAAFVRSLSDEQKAMIEDIVQDARDHGWEDGAREYGWEDF